MKLKPFVPVGEIVVCLFVLLFVGIVSAIHPETVRLDLRELNRLLERRQLHQYETLQAYRYLINKGYILDRPYVIAQFYRQLRSLHYNYKDDTLITEQFEFENVRMNQFANDVNRINQISQYRLYRTFGNVKDNTFDDLNGFLIAEINTWHRKLEEILASQQASSTYKNDRRRLPNV